MADISKTGTSFPKSEHLTIRKRQPDLYVKNEPKNKTVFGQNASDKAQQFKQGDAVYIRDAQYGWTDATVVDVDYTQVTVQSKEAGVQTVSSADVIDRVTSQTLVAVDDLTQISPISTPTVLSCLRERYSHRCIYTRAGSTLVAVNPFQNCSDLYTEEVMMKYYSTPRDEQNKLPPHIYQVARQAEEQLFSSYRSTPANQSIIISGESGAGKTVSAKHLMQYLAMTSCIEGSKSNRRKSMMLGAAVERRILKSNPILEAFGNASTIRNGNSSRFGKYLQLQFERNGKLIGAALQTYLLEKTRVVHQAVGDRNFHVFYQLLHGCPQDILDALFGIQKGREVYSSDFMYADKSSSNNESDAAGWCLLHEAFTEIGVTDDQQMAVCKLLFAILHLGNIEFSRDEEDCDVCIINTANKASLDGLDISSRLLGIEANRVEKAFTCRRITATHKRRQSIFHKPCDPAESASRRDCLAKLIYPRLFLWLVDIINTSMKSVSPTQSIGILDIYGFESFETNCLEQLCINYANEKLQQHFIVHYLKDLQEEYVREGLSWRPTQFTDNQPCLDLLDSPCLSIFSLLNEECQLNRATESSLLTERLLTGLAQYKHIGPASRSGANKQHFVIKHYPTSVTYSVCNMVDKNKDNIPEELLELLDSSDDTMLKTMLQPMEEVSLPGRKRKTVLSKFKASVDGLMKELEATQPHCVKCIKPNHTSQAGYFDGAYVLTQLREGGLVQTVDISQRAHPTRMLYGDFLQHFKVILTNANGREKHQGVLSTVLSDEEDIQQIKCMSTPQKRKRMHSTLSKLRRRTGVSSADHCRKLCNSILTLAFGDVFTKCPAQTAQFGNSKIFLTVGKFEELVGFQNYLLHKFAITIQSRWRAFFMRKRYLIVRKSTCIIQTAVRAFLLWRKEKRLAESIKGKESACQDPILVSNELCSTPESCHLKVRFADTSALEDENFRTPATCPEQMPHLNSPAKSCYYTPAGNTILMPEYLTPVSNKQTIPDHEDASVLITAEQLGEKLTFSISPSPTKNHPASCSAKNAFRTVASAITAAFLTKNRFHLVGAFSGLPYFEVGDGMISRRRMPRVAIKFHTQPNSVFNNGHLISQREFMCSLSDCLDEYD